MPKKRAIQEVPLAELSRYFRVPAHGLPVHYSGRELLLESRITNVSAKGVFIATRSPLPTGAPVSIEFKLPTGERNVCAECVVRWSNPNRSHGSPPGMESEGMGLEFTKISRRDKRAVERYISDFLIRMRSKA